MSHTKRGGRVSPGDVRYGEINARSRLDRFLVRFGLRWKERMLEQKEMEKLRKRWLSR